MILTACDGNYLREASTLIKSCARHEPARQLYLYLVNDECTPERVFQHWHPNIIVERVIWNTEPSRWRGLMSSMRSIVLEHALTNYQEPVLYLDADMLVRGSLVQLWSILDECDLLVKHRPEIAHLGVAGTTFASRFNAGAIGVRPTKAGLKFVRLYNSLLREHIQSDLPIVEYRPQYQVDVYADQELLYVAYHKLQNELVFQALPDKYNDAKFAVDSRIWHGKGTARKHPLYKVENMRYVHPLLYYPGAVLNIGIQTIRSVRRLMRSC